MRRGTIRAFSATWASGIAVLILETPEGRPDIVYCENSPTVRAFAACYADEQVILPGHVVNTAALIGKQIYYHVGFSGVLDSFMPVEDSEL